MPQPQSKATIRKVTFTCSAPNAHSVAIAGDFNDWDPNATPMSHVDKDNWQIKLRLTPGKHQFKYVIDGQWFCNPGVDDHCCEADGETVENPFWNQEPHPGGLLKVL